jgi:hypothetical protein
MTTLPGLLPLGDYSIQRCAWRLVRYSLAKPIVSNQSRQAEKSCYCCGKPYILPKLGVKVLMNSIWFIRFCSRLVFHRRVNSRLSTIFWYDNNNNNNNNKHAYAGTSECFTHLGALLVPQAPRHRPYLASVADGQNCPSLRWPAGTGVSGKLEKVGTS